MNDTREVKEIVVQDDSRYMGSNLPVSQADLNQLSEQRKMLKEFIKNELVVDVDFGIIPGTPKPSLYKPGAEKLNRLFGLGAKFTCVEKEVDRRDNFASYTYKCEIYHLKSGRVIAECEALCNSQEKKYKERSVWKKENGKSYKVTEPTPIADIQNTLMKMSQKRAMVGATILACGASDFFTQDLEDMDDESSGLNTGGDSLTPEQKREAKVNHLIGKFKTIGVSENMIRRKYNLASNVSFSTLTDEQCLELEGIGRAISQKQTTVKEQFPIVNFAEGAGGQSR